MTGAKDLIAAHHAAATFYRQMLLAPSGEGPRSYLTARGFSCLLHDTAWTVGYAPAGWTTTLDHLRAQGFQDHTLVESGLVSVTKRGTLIDRLRDRVTFGMHDPDGGLVAFIGRAAPGARPGSPKYLGSPSTAIYRKGDMVFGLHEQTDRLRAGSDVVIVEGPLDAVAISQSTGAAGLALCGTAMTPSHANLIANSSSDAVLCLDSDRAGRTAIVRSSTLLWARQVNVKVAMLPNGDDPASLKPSELGLALREAGPAEKAVAHALLDGRPGLEDNVEAQLAAVRHAARVFAEAPPPNEAIAAKELCARTKLGYQLATAELAEAITERNGRGRARRSY